MPGRIMDSKITVKKGQVVRQELFLSRQTLTADGTQFRKFLLRELKALVEICTDAFVGSPHHDVRVIVVIQEERE
jgi:hypothetical protein